MQPQRRRTLRTSLAVASLVAAMWAGVSQSATAPTTLEDFFLPGSQPDGSDGLDFDPILPPDDCRGCHRDGPTVEVPIYRPWQGSMMAQSMRDPLFHACLAVANQDAGSSGDLCLRCHTPGGWLAGRSDPATGGELIEIDFEGVSCNVCHRLVDPDYKPGTSPIEDAGILDTLSSNGLLPAQPHSGTYVVDPWDVRRGPLFDVPENWHGVDIIPSPFHKTSELCATCHDVSNPVFSRLPDGTYMLNSTGLPHETQNKYDMFPVERTYSEWLNSAYATSNGVDHGGVFGGEHPTGIMRTCQDCHMPRWADAGACAFADTEPFFRRDVPTHDFHGGNAWVQDMIANLYPGDVDFNALEQSKNGAIYMLQNAATMNVSSNGCDITVRVTNQTGHKLPTGYPEGRRMWLEVLYLDAGDQPLTQRGYYDPATADLITSDTKVYEAELGVDATMAATTGLPEGPTFHFVLNNMYYKDNRIPPRGFTNAAFEAVGAQPVAASYADGQFWDDTSYRIPPGAAKAVVSLWYQTASKEYIEFLRDENTSNDTGDILHAQWEITGKSPPVLMRQVTVVGLAPTFSFGDFNCDGRVDIEDQPNFADCISAPGHSFDHDCTAGDADYDGDVDLDDFANFQRVFQAP